MSRARPVAKPKGSEKEEGPKPLTHEELVQQLADLHDKAEEAQSQRIVLQLERDMLSQLVKSTEEDIEAISKRKEIARSEMELKQQEHDQLVKSYMQKIKQLEYENVQTLERIEKEGVEEMKREDSAHQNFIKTTQDINAHLNDEFNRKRSKRLKKIAKNEEEFQTILQTTKTDFETALEKFRKLNDKFLEDLEKELELKIKSELHDIEERKNCHINQLIKNHEVDYEELRNFYNAITVENLALIQAQREEIVTSHENHSANLKKLAELRRKNVEFEKEKEESEREVASLTNAVKQCHKDKSSLQNLKIKLKTLQTKMEELKVTRKEFDKKFDALVDEIADKKSEYCDEMQYALSIAGASIPQQKEELEHHRKVLELHDEAYLGVLANIPDAADVAQNTENMFKQKDEIVKRLEYMKSCSIRAFNESLKTYKQKLTQLGIDHQSINFQPFKEA